MTDTIRDSSSPKRRRSWLYRYELGLTTAALIVLFIVVFFWASIFVSIPAGHRGVLWSRFSGTYVDRVYPEGIHLIAPWDVLTIYDVRYQTVDRTFTILSQDGLPVDVDVTMRFKPSESQLGALHARVGPGYIDTIVIPEVAAAMRAVIGNFRPEALYAAGFEALQEQVAEYATPQTGVRYVVLDDLLIRQITLPPAVISAIERKFQQEQASQEMQFRLSRELQEAERKAVEAGGIRTYNQTVAQTLTAGVLQYKGIEATLELARSNNAKVIVIGAGNSGLPLILNPDGSVTAAAPAAR